MFAWQATSEKKISQEKNRVKERAEHAAPGGHYCLRNGQEKRSLRIRQKKNSPRGGRIRAE